MVVSGSMEQQLGHAEQRADSSPPIVARVASEVRRADEELVSLVQERPIVTLCVAATVGYLIGRVVTRLS